MNPARTFGPDLVSSVFPVLWAYVVGPAAGAMIAVALFRLVGPERQTLTAKLFHDPGYPSVHATSLPAKPHRDSGQGGLAPTMGTAGPEPATSRVEPVDAHH